MTFDARVRLGLRTIAVAIAVAALIDPAVTSRRTTKPDIAVIATDSLRDAAIADEVASSVERSFTVARGPLAGAAASVIVGGALPPNVAVDAPIFAIAPRTDRPSVRLEKLAVPKTAPTTSRVPVVATIRVMNARGKSVDVALRDGAVAVDRVTRAIARDDDTLSVSLTFVPSSAQPTVLRTVAHIDGSPDAVGDALVDVVDRRWPVLFYDPRPSWMSTFARRAIERDPRFVVTSRVVTSRDVNTASGNPPGRLDDLSALSLFDAVIVGSPSAMSTNDVAGLEAFMRRRGGSVVLLLDDLTPGPHDRLMDVGKFNSTSGNQTIALRSAGNDSSGLQATTFAWPATLPVGAGVIAGGARPTVWSEPVGAGRLVVSGAFDAWRFRDPSTSSFDRFWQTTIANAANATPTSIVLSTSSEIFAPGERFDVDAWLRDEALDARGTSDGPVQARLTLDSSADVLRLWPGAPGTLTARLRAPQTPGVHHVAVSVSGQRAGMPVVVGPDLRRVEAGSEAALHDWAVASGGAVVSASHLENLPDLLRRAIHIEPRPVTWHPMRSAWWIFPFVLALSVDWWLRRRRGLP